MKVNEEGKPFHTSREISWLLLLNNRMSDSFVLHGIRIAGPMEF